MNIPKEAQELFIKANEHIDNKEFEKALSCLNRALEIEPNYAETMSKLGYIHYRLDYKKMSKEQVFNLSKKALDLNPKSPIVWRYMGIAYVTKKEYVKAIECYEKAVEIDPNYVSAWYNMGNAYHNKKEYDKAIECYEKAVKIDPNSDISRKIEYGFYQIFREKQAILRKKYPDLDLTNYKDFLEKSEVIEDPIVDKFGILFLIPFSIQNTIRKTILELGVKYNRLQIAEIVEKCGEREDCIILVAQDMIENKEIYAEYFKSTKSLVFDQRANIDEIDKLMEQYKQWEEEGISKK